MTKSVQTTLRLASMVLVVLIALIGSLLVLDVIQGAEARELLTKTLLVMGILTIASLAVLFLTGSSAGNPPDRQGT